MRTNAYIDASNLFYGGRKSLGWSIDYEKLYKYLKGKYQTSEVFFFGGAEIHKFPFDYLRSDSVPVKDLEKYLVNLIQKKGEALSEAELKLLDHQLILSRAPRTAREIKKFAGDKFLDFEYLRELLRRTDLKEDI